MERMNMFTLLAGPGGGCRDGPAMRRGDEAGRRQRLVGIRDPGGEGPAEAVAEAKQDAWNGSTQAGVRNKMRNNDLRFGYGHASVALRSPS